MMWNIKAHFYPSHKWKTDKWAMIIWLLESFIVLILLFKEFFSKLKLIALEIEEKTRKIKECMPESFQWINFFFNFIVELYFGFSYKCK